jgi:outer membrane autotransporter protein
MLIKIGILLEIYGKFLWAQVGGDTVSDSRGIQVAFDKTTSVRTRVGARYSHEFNQTVKAYFSLGWEHEFEGQIGSRCADDRYRLRPDSPELCGSSVFGS